MERHDRPVRSHRHIRIERVGHARVESQVVVDADGLALATIDAQCVGCQTACAFTFVGAIESLRISRGWPNVMMHAIRRVLPQRSGFSPLSAVYRLQAASRASE